MKRVRVKTAFGGWSVGQEFVPDSGTWRDYLVQNGFVDVIGEVEQPSRTIRMSHIAAKKLAKNVH